MANEDKDFGKKKGGNELMTVFILNIVSLLVVSTLLLFGMFFMLSATKDEILNKVNIEAVESEEEETEEIQRGIIVELGDFILNLSDDNARKYLKVNVAVEVSKKESENLEPEPAPAGGGGHGHGSAPAPVDPLEAIQKEMNQFKPAIRDAVITNLTSKTSTELSTTAGKELAKEQIADEINSIFAGEREVLRVSFGQFIIQ